MATGPRARALNTSGIASMHAQIASLIVQGSAAKADAYASMGRSIGGGIGSAIGNVRADKAQKAADAQRAAERDEARAEREQDRAERRSERAEDKAYQRERDAAEMTFRERAFEVNALKGRAAEAAKAAAEAQTKAALQARMDAGMGGDPAAGQAATAEAQSKGITFKAIMERLSGMGPAPKVLREDGMGGVVDETSATAQYEAGVRHMAGLQRAAQAAAEMEDPKAIYAAEAAIRFHDRRLTALKSAAEMEGAQKQAMTQKRAEIAEGQKRNAKTAAAMEAVRSTAKALGVSESEALRYVKGDVQAGATPETIRSALTNRFKAQKPQADPRERAGYEVDVETAKEEKRAAALRAKPQQEREDLYEEEYAREARTLRAQDMQSADLEAALDSLAARLGRKYGL